ncbi:MAG: glycosyltransferase family 2 protein [Candidatus Hodarchaeota archaeon]
MERENSVVLVWVYSYNNLRGLKQTVESFLRSTYIARLIFIEDDNSNNQSEIQSFIDDAICQGLPGYFYANSEHQGFLSTLKKVNFLSNYADWDFILIVDDRCVLDEDCVSCLVNHWGDTARYARNFRDLFPWGWCLSKAKFNHLIIENKEYIGGDEVIHALISINNPIKLGRFEKLKDRVKRIWKR